MTTGNSDRPQYHLLPRDDPARAVQILRVAAGLDDRGSAQNESTADSGETGRYG